MLIFVQVYRTIDKNLETIYRLWMNEREQRTAPEVKSAPEDIALLK